MISATRQQTIFSRALRRFSEKTREQFAKVNAWRRNAGESVGKFFGGITEWMLECKGGIIITLAVLVWVVLMIWFIADASSGRVKGSAVQVGVGGIIGGAIVGLVGSPIAGGAVFLVLLLLNLVLRLFVVVLLYPPLLIWLPIYATWRILVLAAQLLVLVPLFLLFLVTRAVQLWKGIFWTCPSRRCGYRGLPGHICPDCGQVNDRLWPSIYGVLGKPCAGCDRKLPTIGTFGSGRSQLKRVCGDPACRMPLLGRHAGRVPERLVAIVGGPKSGKTNYLLMAVDELVNGNGRHSVRMKGEIDDPDQDAEFQRQWSNMLRGSVPAKTAEVANAFLLHARVNGSRSQLYLYDSPGEEFTSMSQMTQQQYFRLLEGLVVLVDPNSLPRFAPERKGERYEVTPLQKVIDATLMWATSSVEHSRRGTLPMRAAVVIAKADLPSVRAVVGDIREGHIEAKTCRQAIIDWGGAAAIQAMENRFEAVEYFACSALGREPDAKVRERFVGAGVLPPLGWILTGKRE